MHIKKIWYPIWKGIFCMRVKRSLGMLRAHTINSIISFGSSSAGLMWLHTTIIIFDDVLFMLILWSRLCLAHCNASKISIMLEIISKIQCIQLISYSSFEYRLLYLHVLEANSFVDNQTLVLITAANKKKIWNRDYRTANNIQHVSDRLTFKFAGF